MLWRREIQHLFLAQLDINVKQDQTWEWVLWFLAEHEASALLWWAGASSCTSVPDKVEGPYHLQRLLFHI